MSRNSWNGKSGDGTGAGTDSETEVEVLCWIFTPFSERRISLLGSWIFFSTNILPVCCCCTGKGLYSLYWPFSSKNSASVCGNVLAMFMQPEPVEED